MEYNKKEGSVSAKDQATGGHCFDCGKALFGRSGKMYCNTKCQKNSYYQKKKSEADFLDVSKDILWPMGHSELNGNDTINPDHYRGDIECIDAIKASMSKEAFKGYLKGTITKYLWRYEKKGLKEDIEKCEWFILKLKEQL